MPLFLCCCGYTYYLNFINGAEGRGGAAECFPKESQIRLFRHPAWRFPL